MQDAYDNCHPRMGTIPVADRTEVVDAFVCIDDRSHIAVEIELSFGAAPCFNIGERRSKVA